MQSGVKRTLSALVSIGVSFALGMIVGVTGSKGSASEPQPESGAETKTVSGPIPEAGDGEALNALRRRVKELERQLAAKGGAAAEEAVPGGDRRAEGPQRFNPREMIERMKKDDPARYNDMTNRMANFRRMRAERAQGKIDFLSSIDTSAMSAEDRANHERLQTLIAKREEIEEKMRTLFELSDDEQAATFREMGELHLELADASRREREILLNETAGALGLGGEDAEALTETVKEIYEATDEGFRMPGGPGGHHGRGGHHGPGGRGGAR